MKQKQKTSNNRAQESDAIFNAALSIHADLPKTIAELDNARCITVTPKQGHSVVLTLDEVSQYFDACVEALCPLNPPGKCSGAFCSGFTEGCVAVKVEYSNFGFDITFKQLDATLSWRGFEVRLNSRAMEMFDEQLLKTSKAVGAAKQRQQKIETRPS